MIGLCVLANNLPKSSSGDTTPPSPVNGAQIRRYTRAFILNNALLDTGRLVHVSFKAALCVDTPTCLLPWGMAAAINLGREDPSQLAAWTLVPGGKNQKVTLDFTNKSRSYNGRGDNTVHGEGHVRTLRM